MEPFHYFETPMIEKLCENAGIHLSKSQYADLEQFADLMEAKNKVLNLTRIVDRKDFMIKQILNSLMLGKIVHFKPGLSVVDLGTGGGFPGIPLAIAHPEAQFFLVDSVQKKIRAVEEFVDQLELKNVKALSERIEILGHDSHTRQRFDLVTAQALAPLPVLLELSTPLVKIGGLFVAMKGPNYLEEIAQSANAMKQLKTGEPKIESYELPEGAGSRYLLMFHKTQMTPSQYPRAVGIPNKKSL
jgi:16S rRNA (guanine527-N7)-methyltransferase